MAEKYINIDLEDPRSSEIAEVLSNKTSKKILSLLAEKELNASELSKELNLPLNTIGYNLEKLVSAGLIEKSKKFFWSVKGKKIDSYTIINKKIIISPRSIIKGIVPAVLLSAIIAAGLGFFGKTQISSTKASASLMKTADSASPTLYSSAEKIASTGTPTDSFAPTSETATNIIQTAANNADYAWAWFLLGALVALLAVLIWNWRKK